MAAFDYTELAEEARELIEEVGREIELFRLGTTPADTTEPWRGPANPRLPAAEAVQAAAVQVDPANAVRLGLSSTATDFVKRAQVIYVVPADGIEADLTRFDELLDEEVRYRITGVERLRPGDTTLLYFVGAAR